MQTFYAIVVLRMWHIWQFLCYFVLPNLIKSLVDIFVKVFMARIVHIVVFCVCLCISLQQWSVSKLRKQQS